MSDDTCLINSFIRSQKLAVISTVNIITLQPESALIAFAEDSGLNIYFQTGKYTRKAENLRLNDRVSLVFGLLLEAKTTVQYEGTANQLTDPDEITICKKRFLDKDSPTTPEYLDRPDRLLFKVTPTWIGYSGYSGKKPIVRELLASSYCIVECI